MGSAFRAARFVPSAARRELYSCTVYVAGRDIRTRSYYDEMVASERNALFVRLRRRAWSQTKIARRHRLTEQGVSKSLLRIAEGRPGRGPRGESEC